MDQRAPNITAADRREIDDLAQKYHHIIENKRTDICTNKEKEIARKKFGKFSAILLMSEWVNS